MSGLAVTIAPILDAPDLARRTVEAPHGLTIAEIVALHLPHARPADLRVVLVSREGEWAIDMRYWRARPKAHARVVIRMVGHGDLRGVLMLVVSIAASLVAGPLAIGLGFGGGFFGLSATGLLFNVARAGITLGLTALGGLLVNALAPLPSQGKEKPVFTASAMQNPFDPEAPPPVLFGDLRYAPPYGMPPYTEIVKDEQFLIVSFLLGYGPQDISELKLGDTLLSKFDEVHVEIRTGLPDDEPFTLCPVQRVTEKVAVDLTRPLPRNDAGETIPGPAEAKPQTRWSAPDAAGFRLIWWFQRGLIFINDKGKERKTAVSIRIRVRAEGEDDWTEIETVTIHGKQKEPFFRQYDGTFPTRGPRYEVELTNLTSEYPENDSTMLHMVQWIELQSVRPEYPFADHEPMARISLRIKATHQLQGQIDNFNVRAKPVIRDFAGEAGWIARATVNPSSAAIAALTGSPNPRAVGDTAIHWPDFEAWHQFCVAKGLTYNRLHDFRARFGDVLAQIGAAGRAAIINDGEKWRVIIDRPRDLPATMISARNAWDFRTTVEPFSPPDGWVVPFVDASNGWSSASMVVPWPADVRFATREEMEADLAQDQGTRAEVYGDPVQLNNGYYHKQGASGAGLWLARPIVLTEQAQLFGKTDYAEIWRETRRQQYERIHRSMIHTAWQPGNARLATPGDLIVASRATMTRRTAEARVRSVRGKLVEVDTELQFDEGVDYVIRWLDIGAENIVGDMHVRAVTAEPGMRTSFEMAGPDDGPSPAPVIIDGQRRAPLIHFGVAGHDSLDLILTRVQRGRDDTAMLEMRPAAPIIDELTDAEIPPPWNGRVGSIAVPSTAVPAAPSVMRIEPTGLEGTGAGDGMTVFLRPGGSSIAIVGSYEIRHKLAGAGSYDNDPDDGETPLSASVASGAIDVPGYALGDDVTFQARARSTSGIVGPWTGAITITLGEDDLDAPAALLSVAVTGGLGVATLGFSVLAGDNATEIQIFRNTGGALNEATHLFATMGAAPGSPHLRIIGDPTRTEILVNGTMATDTDWTKGGGVSHSVDGFVHAVGSGGTLAQNISAALAASPTGKFRYGYDVSLYSGSGQVLPRLDGGSGTVSGSSGLSGDGTRFGTLQNNNSGKTGITFLFGASMAGKLNNAHLILETPTCHPAGEYQYWLRSRNDDGIPGPLSGPHTIKVY